MKIMDLTEQDLKEPVPEGLTEEEELHWRYQRYIKDYLRCVQSVDDSVGELLDSLGAENLFENTVVIYTSDQGFFLGDHNCFDKRFMYEESLKMPFLVSYPPEIAAGSVGDAMVLNVDFPATFMDWAGLEVPEAWQGVSARECFKGEVPSDWRDAMYYRYWMHKDGCHNVYAHYGLRTHHHKLICYYADALDAMGDRSQGYDGKGISPEPPEWELFDLKKDPNEMLSVYNDPDYEGIVAHLKERLAEEMAKVQDEPYDHPDCR